MNINEKLTLGDMKKASLRDLVVLNEFIAHFLRQKYDELKEWKEYE